MPQAVIRNEQWAIEQFRPLLDQIDISNIPRPPDHILLPLSRYAHFRKLGLGDCVFIVRRRVFESTVNGYYTFSHKIVEDKPIFFLTIFLNEHLFVSNTPNQKIKRRQILIHEFTHCIAAFLLLEKSNRANDLIAVLTAELITHTKLNRRNHYQSLIVHFGNGPIPMANALGIFPDEHFRLNSINFQGSFATLYKYLMLDFNIFEKYFSQEYRNQFKEHIQNGNVSLAYSVLTLVSSALIATELISADFVKMRIREQLLSHYYLEAIKESMQEESEDHD